ASACSPAPSDCPTARISAIGRPSPRRYWDDAMTKAMKLWRPSPLGPRKRAPAIETASVNSCGPRLLAALQIPPRATDAPVVAAASEMPASGVGPGTADLLSIGNRSLEPRAAGLRFARFEA